MAGFSHQLAHTHAPLLPPPLTLLVSVSVRVCIRATGHQTVLNSASQSDVWHGNVERCIKHRGLPLFSTGKEEEESAVVLSYGARCCSRRLSTAKQRLPPDPRGPRTLLFEQCLFKQTKGSTVPTERIRLPSHCWTGFRFGSIAAMPHFQRNASGRSYSR